MYRVNTVLEHGTIVTSLPIVNPKILLYNTLRLSLLRVPPFRRRRRGALIVIDSKDIKCYVGNPSATKNKESVSYEST